MAQTFSVNPILEASDRTQETLIRRVARHAQTKGQRPALILLLKGTTVEISYEALFRYASGYSSFFAQHGVSSGDLVFLSLEHTLDLYAAYLGAMALGAVPAMLAFPTSKQDPLLYWEMHQALFERIGAGAILTYPGNRADLAAALPARTRLLVTPAATPTDPRPLAELAAGLPCPAADETVLVQFSSGTTGIRKGVALTHAQVATQVGGYSQTIGATEQTRIASWLPLYHDMGLMTAFVIPFFFGGTVVSLDPFEWAANPHSLFETMDQFRCTYAWLPNFAFNHLVRTKIGDEAYRLDHVEALINCSEPCKRATFDLFGQTFASHGIRSEQLQTCYGMAETVFAVSQSHLGIGPRTLWLDTDAASKNHLVTVSKEAPGATSLLSNGPPIPGIEIRIVGGELGEIQVRGAFVFDGYLKAPDLTADAFDDGWYKTGDIGCLVDGEIFIAGRIKDIIIHHGRNYYAHDIEALAGSVPGIKPGRCVALGFWNHQVGSEEIGIVAERDPAHPEEDQRIRQGIRQLMENHLNVAVAVMHLADPGWLVKTTSGKISRGENMKKYLRERAKG